ncbi:MAG: metal-sulfur cluster assembly factor [Chitinophagaceae bacterium]|nr:MAG: metal-sulfur cluster assembly factor [Chitinophagaceae bacterium]
MSVTTNNNLKCTIALAVLEQVMDPELQLSVVDLGLLYQLDFDDNPNRIFVRMTLTTRFCPMGQSIVDSVKRALESAFTGAEIIIDLCFEPAWTHDRISASGKAFLNR